MNTHHSNPTLSDADPAQRTPAFSSNTKIADPAETLMVVDDDPMVRALEVEILRLEGYTVLAAEGAREALRLAAETARIHLLVTDFKMPEIDGIELTHRLRAVHPKIPVLMVSGSLPLAEESTQGLERFECLPKPFKIKELVRKVRALLDTAAPLPRRPAQWSDESGR
jgi:DNA-binding response OmpR family regulator